jgi:hypothetical protein
VNRQRIEKEDAAASNKEPDVTGNGKTGAVQTPPPPAPAAKGCTALEVAYVIKGITLMRVALLLCENDEELARTMRKKWQNKKAPPLPEPIGWKDGREPLYEPSALTDFLEKFGEPLKGCKATFIKTLRNCMVLGTKEKQSK